MLKGWEDKKQKKKKQEPENRRKGRKRRRGHRYNHKHNQENQKDKTEQNIQSAPSRKGEATCVEIKTARKKKPKQPIDEGQKHGEKS